MLCNIVAVAGFLGVKSIGSFFVLKLANQSLRAKMEGPSLIMGVLVRNVPTTIIVFVLSTYTVIPFISPKLSKE